MIEIGELKRMYRFRTDTFAVAIITLLGVVFVGIVPGILVAVAMSLFLLIATISRPNDSHLVRVGEVLEYHHISDGPLAQFEFGLAVYRLDGIAMSANSGRMKIRVMSLIEASGTEIYGLILDLGMSTTTDLTTVSAIEEMADELRKKGVRLMVVELNEHVLELFRRAGTDKKLGSKNMCPTVKSAVSAFHSFSKFDL